MSLVSDAPEDSNSSTAPSVKSVTFISNPDADVWTRSDSRLDVDLVSGVSIEYRLFRVTASLR